MKLDTYYDLVVICHSSKALAHSDILQSGLLAAALQPQLMGVSQSCDCHLYLGWLYVHVPGAQIQLQLVSVRFPPQSVVTEQALTLHSMNRLE